MSIERLSGNNGQLGYSCLPHEKVAAMFQSEFPRSLHVVLSVLFCFLCLRLGAGEPDGDKRNVETPFHFTGKVSELKPPKAMVADGWKLTPGVVLDDYADFRKDKLNAEAMVILSLGAKGVAASGEHNFDKDGRRLHVRVLVCTSPAVAETAFSQLFDKTKYEDAGKPGVTVMKKRGADMYCVRQGNCIVSCSGSTGLEDLPAQTLVHYCEELRRVNPKIDAPPDKTLVLYDPVSVGKAFAAALRAGRIEDAASHIPKSERRGFLLAAKAIGPMIAKDGKVEVKQEGYRAFLSIESIASEPLEVDMVYRRGRWWITK